MKVYPPITPHKRSTATPHKAVLNLTVNPTDISVVNNHVIEKLTQQIQLLQQVIINNKIIDNNGQSNVAVQYDTTTLQQQYNQALNLLKLYQAKLHATQAELNGSKQVQQSQQKQPVVPPLDISKTIHQPIIQQQKSSHSQQDIQKQRKQSQSSDVSLTSNNQSLLSQSVIINNKTLNTDVDTNLADVADIITLHKKHYAHSDEGIKHRSHKKYHKPQIIALREISSDSDSSTDTDIENVSNNSRISHLLAIQRSNKHNPHTHNQHRSARHSNAVLAEIRQNIEQAELLRAAKQAQANNTMLHDITTVQHHSERSRSAVNRHTTTTNTNNAHHTNGTPLTAASEPITHTVSRPRKHTQQQFNNDNADLLNMLSSTTNNITHALQQSHHIHARHELKQLYHNIPAVLAALNHKQNKLVRQQQKAQKQQQAAAHHVEHPYLSRATTSGSIHHSLHPASLHETHSNALLHTDREIHTNRSAVVEPVHNNNTVVVQQIDSDVLHHLTDNMDESVIVEQLNAHKDDVDEIAKITTELNVQKEAVVEYNRAIDDLLNE